MSAVENSDDLTDEQRKVVVRVFRDAEARADKRALARRAGASPEEGGDGGDGSAKPTA